MLDFMIFDTNAPRGRILVVDDDPVLRTMLVVSLAEAGHDVLQAEDGARALDLMLLDKSKNCLPEVLVTDIQMPPIGRHWVAGAPGCGKTSGSLPL
jgi:CheY-like chemotaxis protein